MIRVAQISESEFTVQGHGVHTAFVELTNALKSRDDVEVFTNKLAPRDVAITHLHTVGMFSLRRLLFDTSKKVVSAHVVPASFVGSLVGAKAWAPLATWYLRWFYNRADLVLAVSDETRRELIKLGVTKPIEIVYNLIDTTRYKTTAVDKATARKKLKLSSSDWVVVGAGQVQPRKRVNDFVDAARKLPDMRFIWVGGMPFGRAAAGYSAMQKLIDSAPNNVEFTGVIDLKKVKKYYQAADVFWLPSEQETFGLVVVEAAAANLPVMLRDIPDYKETFADNAVMVPTGNEVKTLRKLRDDTAFYKEAQNGSRQIAERFDAKAGAERMVKLYETLL